MSPGPKPKKTCHASPKIKAALGIKSKFNPNCWQNIQQTKYLKIIGSVFIHIMRTWHNTFYFTNWQPNENCSATHLGPDPKLGNGGLKAQCVYIIYSACTLHVCSAHVKLHLQCQMFTCRTFHSLFHSTYLDDTNQSLRIFVKDWLKSRGWKTQDRGGNCSSRRHCFVRSWISLKYQQYSVWRKTDVMRKSFTS